MNRVVSRIVSYVKLVAILLQNGQRCLQSATLRAYPTFKPMLRKLRRVRIMVDMLAAVAGQGNGRTTEDARGSDDGASAMKLFRLIPCLASETRCKCNGTNLNTLYTFHRHFSTHIMKFQC